MSETESQAERTVDTPGERESRARRIVKTHMWVSMGVGLVPLPFVDLVGVTAVQLRMLHELTKLYDVPFSRDLGKELIGALLGSVVPVTIGSAVKMLPVVGYVVGGLSMPLLAGAATYAIGKVFIQHFETGGTLLDFEPAKVREHFRQEFAEGQGLAAEGSEAAAPEQETSAGRPSSRSPRGRAPEATAPEQETPAGL